MTANDYEELITYLRQNGEFKRQKEIKSWTIYLNTSKEEFYKKIKKPNIRKIGYNDFEYLNIIGKGSFGTILLGKNKITKEYFAIKVVDKKTKFSRVGNEVKILSGIHCPFIVEMLTYFEYKNSLYLILQLIPGGDLSSLLDRFGRLDESVSRFYAAQVLLAIEYLHCLDIVYRDIKPENILMDASGYIKLTDLGLSKHLKKGRTYTFCGTPEYIAPEVILSKGYGKSIDYWAFGILLFELNSGKTPFYTKSHYYTFAKISDDLEF
ncbi:hypothetical protein O3M35_007590 [Rhynocoris fuscipes]|uniref:non-specific serine/threonine protein kinase n=1 Tax=Rhynocoris fuscipes TaxID=488301 RepID=A0AAW1D9X7_9HEMI